VTVPPLPDEDSLRVRVTRGLRWSAMNTLVLRLGSLAAGAALLRLLTPEDYGVYAAALVVVTALLSMNELGVSLAIVRRDGDVRAIAPTVATLALATSGVLYVLTFLAAPGIASIMNAPAATPMIRVLSTCVLLDAIATVPAQVLAREFAQGRRFGIDLVAFAGGTALSITLALAGLGPWALVWGFLLGNVIASGLALALTPWRTRFGFDREVARDLLHFGLPLAGSSLLLFAMMNVDYLVVGNILGATALGFYLTAFNLCSWPVNLVATTMRRVSLSVFSRVGGTGASGQRAFRTVLAGALLLAVPMSTGLAVFAPEIIQTLYGPTWLPAAEALRPLAVLAVGRVVVELTYDFLVSADRNRANLVIQATWLVALVPALIIGAHLGGIRGVGLAHAVVVCTVVTAVVLFELRKAGVLPSALGRSVARPMLTSVPMAVVGLVCVWLVPNPLAALLVGGSLAVAVYGLLNLGMVRRLLVETRGSTA
jgi:O-antigen/teichoic acid export membrane protein